MKAVAFIGPSSTKGATIARLRRPATKVMMVFQWACGTWSINRCPRGQRPRSRTTLVEIAVSRNTSRAGSNMPCSRIQRRRARATFARSCSAARRLFLKLILWCLKKRHTALRLPAILRLCIGATISSSVRSACRPISANKKAACASSGEMLPPLGLGAKLPVARRRCIHLVAELGLTSNQSTASCRDAPDSTAPTTRSRNSKEHWLRHGSATQNPNQCRQIQRSTPSWESRFNPAEIRSSGHRCERY